MNMLRFFKNLSVIKLQSILTFASVIITARIIFIQHDWVNDDSLLYFECARLFAAGEWNKGFSLFPWPLYSLLIAAVHKLTGFSFQLSAQAINIIMIAIATYSLLKIIVLGGGNKLTLLIASLLLFGSPYIFGDVAAMLLRDQGFWASLLTAWVYLIRFYQHHKLKDAIGWQLSALLATLFRIEAFTYLMLLPFVLLFQQDLKLKSRVTNLLRANIFNLGLLIIGVLAFIAHGALRVSDLGRLSEVLSSLSDIQQNFNATISTKARYMATYVLGEPLGDFAWMSLIISLLSIVLVKCLSVAGWLALIILLINFKDIHTQISSDVKRILLAAAFIAFINAVLIIFKVNILSSRYVIAFGFIIIIFAAFAAEAVVSELRLNRHYSFKSIIMTLLLLLAAIALVLNIQSKNIAYHYETDAVAYVKGQSHHSKVFYSSHKTRHYAGEPYIGRFEDYWKVTEQAVDDGSIYQYDYLLINMQLNEQTGLKEKWLSEKLPQYKLIKTFYGFKNKKAVLVYKKTVGDTDANMQADQAG